MEQRTLRVPRATVELVEDHGHRHVHDETGATDECELHELAEGAAVAVAEAGVAHDALILGVRPGRWQRGQENELRFMKRSRLIGVPQRRHASPSRP